MANHTWGAVLYMANKHFYLHQRVWQTWRVRAFCFFFSDVKVLSPLCSQLLHIRDLNTNSLSSALPHPHLPIGRPVDEPTSWQGLSPFCLLSPHFEQGSIVLSHYLPISISSPCFLWYIYIYIHASGGLEGCCVVLLVVWWKTHQWKVCFSQAVWQLFYTFNFNFFSTCADETCA